MKTRFVLACVPLTLLGALASGAAAQQPGAAEITVRAIKAAMAAAGG